MTARDCGRTTAAGQPCRRRVACAGGCIFHRYVLVPWGQGLTNKRKTRCKRGHLLASTAYRFQDALGRWHRQCRACDRDRRREKAATP